MRAGATRHGFVPSMREVRLVEPHLPGCLTESFRSPSRFWGGEEKEKDNDTSSRPPLEDPAPRNSRRRTSTASLRLTLAVFVYISNMC